MSEETIKLNLGAGPKPMPGYLNLDIKDGTEIGNLPHADRSIDEIRASHVLEHVPWTRTHEILRHWFAKLKPGGLLKVAVPDFDWCVEAYRSGSGAPIEGYIMGGRTDEHDAHGAIFNYDKLAKLLQQLGFEDITRWNSDFDDCSSLQVSLNIQARRPSIQADNLNNLTLVMTSPRFGPVDTMFSIVAACQTLNIPFIKSSGAFWGQCLERIMEDAILESACEYVLTVDFDSLFLPEHIQSLYRVAKRHNLDAVFPVQVKREEDLSLLTVIDEKGNRITEITPEVATRDHMECATGHFGLTLIRAECLRKMAHPWFLGKPNADGKWRDGRTDDDIHFWQKFRAEGFRVWQANQVKIGHLQTVASWPDASWRPHHQYLNDYIKGGPPPCAR